MGRNTLRGPNRLGSTIILFNQEKLSILREPFFLRASEAMKKNVGTVATTSCEEAFALTLFL